MKDLVVLYESGLTIREIANRISKSYEFVRQSLKSQKVKWRKNYLTDFSPEQLQEILNKYDNGWEVQKIASWYEISAPAISRWLKANSRVVISSSKKYDLLRQTPINTIQKQFLVGKLLGDGCLYKDTPKQNYKLSFGHCEKQEEYFHWCIAMFDPFINGFHKSHQPEKNSTMLQTASICHQDLNMFGNMFYDNNRKKIIPTNLDMFMTPLALAVWVQDDGNLNDGVNMRICSQGFSKEQNQDLVDLIKRCFNLDSKVCEYNYKSKKYYYISFNKLNTQKLSDLIRPHVVKSMLYKIMPESSTTSMPNITKNNDDTV